jgi:hypothetical protein
LHVNGPSTNGDTDSAKQQPRRHSLQNIKKLNFFIYLWHPKKTAVFSPYHHKYLISYIFLTNGPTPDIKLG